MHRSIEMIKLEKVSKTYTTGKLKKEVLNEISLTVKDGEFISIMGTSGSGKSTLLNLIGCMDTLTSGEYFYDETQVHRLNQFKLNQFRKKNISFVFQYFALMKRYTVYENVEMPLLIKNISKKERKEIVMSNLERMGITEVADELPGHISGGQQQRCAIARALASGNQVILADEPTGALDQKTGNDIMNRFEEINAEGKTIILVTHDEKIANRTQRILRIEDGRFI